MYDFIKAHVSRDLVRFLLNTIGGVEYKAEFDEINVTVAEAKKINAICKKELTEEDIREYIAIGVRNGWLNAATFESQRPESIAPEFYEQVFEYEVMKLYTGREVPHVTFSYDKKQ